MPEHAAGPTTLVNAPDRMARSTRAQPDFEKSIAELEDIVRQMEDGEIGLEQSLNLYQRGIALVRGCREALDGVHFQIGGQKVIAAMRLLPAAGDEMAGMEAFALKAALHIHHADQHGVDLAACGQIFQVFECQVAGHRLFLCQLRPGGRADNRF